MEVHGRQVSRSGQRRHVPVPREGQGERDSRERKKSEKERERRRLCGTDTHISQTSQVHIL